TGSERGACMSYSISSNKRSRCRASEPMPLLALAARAPDDISPSFPSSRFAVRHHSNVPGAFLSTMSFQDARCGTAFPGNARPTVQDWGQVCRLEAQKLWRFRGIYHNSQNRPDMRVRKESK